MKRTSITCAALLGVVCGAGPTAVLADDGFTDPTTVDPAQTVTVSAYVGFTGAGHVANGIALRNRTMGTISVRGVPAGAGIIKAYLYWNFSDTAAVGPASSGVLFNGNSGSGTKVADNLDPCWSLAGNHTYRRDVTTLIPVGAPNQDYEVVCSSSGTTTGANPWLPTVTGKKFEGATLVIIHTEAASRAVVIYDALSGTEFASALTLNLVHPFSLSGSGVLTMSGADGQRSGGHSNGGLSNETGFFNGVQISGPPVGNSDWDGSAGLPMPQLWDVHSHVVTVRTSPSVVSWVATGDCLVPTVLVIEANTP